MNVDLGDGFPRGLVLLLAVLGVVWGLFVTVFWMVVGWRALRAHEYIAILISRHIHGQQNRGLENPASRADRHG